MGCHEGRRVGQLCGGRWEDFSEEVGGVNEAGKENKTEELLRGPLFKPVETHVDGLGLLRSNRRSRNTNRTLVVDKQ
jgi:hypothetical protein